MRSQRRRRLRPPRGCGAQEAPPTISTDALNEKLQHLEEQLTVLDERLARQVSRLWKQIQQKMSEALHAIKMSGLGWKRSSLCTANS